VPKTVVSLFPFIFVAFLIRVCLLRPFNKLFVLSGETMLKSISRRLQTHGSILELVDPLLSTQAMLATTKIGMWKRNGAPVEGQVSGS
jgi:hypothetical protein